ncbi:hypothetical protein F441_13620 [Phytophthora nicotianae CJ01A1]|uniref:Uncharacterized protein n=6 Tax=Phytophthora nicotianae TaxID=4792 RepID=W2PJ42_PHYN3|nr:hypothetical protein PPTG_24323 [Phytophthora nicotianae INRA-310]ETI32087.1 hypothetical protein F443_21019 [Phytophthora nicotianae P1569]ETK72475.1 hypothetical protein L915_20422 [Phytophthora nicotianae]ETO60821.1 hypothetical protein F444_21024 [Phytophthora nicotianae P1976]ETP10848.1 hypothetical protein F441_13620 [Phytophthora nicotianae CJ01A1]ETP30113.1 hypothetical protein F442_20829 [Phytophthora nicotianae P10297]
MESNQSSTQGQAASIMLVKANDPATTIIKEQKQRELQSQPAKARYISKQSMAYMHC